MVSRVEAHIDDYDKYGNVENRIYEIVKAWNNVLGNSDAIDSKYKLGSIPEESEIEVNYTKPEMIQTESERLASIEKRKDIGLMSPLEAIMEDRGIEDEEAAQEILDKINKSKLDNMNTFMTPAGPEVPGQEDEETEEVEEEETEEVEEN